MSKTEKAEVEVLTTKRAAKLEEVLDHGLAGTIAYAGGELTGFSMKVSQGDCLLTVKAFFPAGHRVSWVGSTNAVDCLLKAEREVATGVLDWLPDKYKLS